MGVRHSGFALIVVLIAVAAVFALAMQGAVMSRSTTLEVGAIHDRVVAERRARAAVVIAVAGLVPSDNAGVSAEEGGTQGAGGAGAGSGAGAGASPGDDDDSIKIPEFLKEIIPELNKVEDKAQSEVGRSESEIARVTQGRGMTSRPPRKRALSMLSNVGLPTTPIRIAVDGSRFRVSMWDAMGLLNINKADEAQLVRYFQAKGVDDLRAVSLAEQIIDWRDEDRVAHPQGAEDEVYARRGVHPRNSDILSLEELLYLPAMDRALFDQISDDLAVGGDGLIHVGTAPRGVLASIPGMTDDAASAIVRLRAEHALTQKSLDALLPPTHREAIRSKLRWNLSGVLRVRVEALEGEKDRVSARFDGAAMVSEMGVQEVGLRPM